MPSCKRKAVTRFIIQKCFILINKVFYKCYFALKVNLYCGYFYAVGCVALFFLKQVNNSVNLEKSGRGFQHHIFKGISYKALKML